MNLLFAPANALYAMPSDRGPVQDRVCDLASSSLAAQHIGPTSRVHSEPLLLAHLRTDKPALSLVFSHPTDGRRPRCSPAISRWQVLLSRPTDPPRSEEEEALRPPANTARWVEVCDLYQAAAAVLAWVATPAPVVERCE
jgi:hypothetical protein